MSCALIRAGCAVYRPLSSLIFPRFTHARAHASMEGHRDRQNRSCVIHHFSTLCLFRYSNKNKFTTHGESPPFQERRQYSETLKVSLSENRTNWPASQLLAISCLDYQTKYGLSFSRIASSTLDGTSTINKISLTVQRKKIEKKSMF